MKPTAKVAVAVAGGYLLGRRKKAKMAIALGSWLIGRKLNINIREIARDSIKGLTESPEFAKLSEEVKQELLESGRNSATTALTSQMDRLSENLHNRTAELSNGNGQSAQPVNAQENAEKSKVSSGQQNS